MPGSMGYQMHSDDKKNTPIKFDSKDHTRVLIKDCGVYKFAENNRKQRATSASNTQDFKPEDFLKARANR